MNKIKRAIPSLFTAGNLMLGVFSIVYSAQNQMTGAAIAIFLAAVLDFFDGFVARLLKAESEFGKQFDSMADCVTFGVAPAILLFYLTEPYLIGWGRYAALFLALFAAIRLAIFNIDTRQTSSFIGLPSPAMGITVASFPLIIEFDKFNVTPIILHPWFTPIFAVVFCYLMVAELPLFALKFKNFSWESNKLTYTFLVLCIGFLVVFQFLGIPFIIFTYVFLSVINKFAN